MGTVKNLLIVEDDEEWRSAYGRAARTEGSFTVRIAQNLGIAEDLIDEMQFAVAFVDIGLNVLDSQNSDGLRVMEKIRTVGDATSIVVVTGRSGHDFQTVADDARTRYNALDIVAKAIIEPQDIRRLLHSGLERFEEETLNSHASAPDFLRGGLRSSKWENEILAVADVTDGVRGLHEFLERLLEPFYPMIPQQLGNAATVDPATQVVHSSYWSRAVGRPVVVSFASRTRFSEHLEIAKSSKIFLERYDITEVLAECSMNGLSGAVCALDRVTRDDFGVIHPLS